MEPKISCIFNWSGGKDSALALYHCLQDPRLDVRYLVTSVNDSVNRVSMHGVREELLIRQARSIGIPLHQIRLPEMPGMKEYDDTMRTHLEKFKAEGITHSIFGDIFLEDLRKYREDRLAEAGLQAMFPLWKRDTTELIHEFLDLGFRTTIVCTQHQLERLAGRELTKELLLAFPEDIDICGENGEFHTFAFDGPIFREPVRFRDGEKVFKEYKQPMDADDSCTTPAASAGKLSGFWYTDLIPV
ncbi:MAG: diphthine--ammonia ligase [Daejeonella sp.]|uniref:Dph6-related ATP pyrophosphatase n=1 Tax=Daejeonella sp. JGW-45 TaxID=3034148 RepID=UPI0023EE27EF|nr:diphthine--ammonia ligase [Daejeonella sp. JGW-45]